MQGGYTQSNPNKAGPDSNSQNIDKLLVLDLTPQDDLARDST